MQLNETAYTIEKDKLIYDSMRLIDAANVTVTVPKEKVGTLKRGQLLDFAEGKYVVHAESGTASVIVAEETPYAADDTDITVPVYVSGNFRKSEVESDVELTAVDLENLRLKEIYLK